MSSVSSSSNQPTHCYFQLHEMGRVLGEIISSEEIPRSENGPTHHTKIVERMYVQIGGPIGSGMYSTILKVASSFDSKEYAFKFPKSLQRNTRHLNESKILRFLSAQSAEDLQGIVKWKETFWIDQKPTLVLEFLRKDLKTLIKETNGLGLSLEDTASLAKQLCKTLAVLKRHQIIHFDIKPANVALVDGNINRMKLIDFEGAFFKNSPPETYTYTREFSSPEVLLEKSPYDSGADEWSVAATLAMAYIGSPLFEIAPTDATIAFLQESRFRQKYPKSLIDHFSEETQQCFGSISIDTSSPSFEDLMDKAANVKSENADVLKTGLQAMFKFDPKERISAEDALKLLEPASNMSEAI